MMHSDVVGIVIALVALLLIAAATAIGLRRVALPYSVGLVLVGLGLGALADRWSGLEMLRAIELSPDVILFVFLPTLIFESAFNLDSRLLARNMTRCSRWQHRTGRTRDDPPGGARRGA